MATKYRIVKEIYSNGIFQFFPEWADDKDDVLHWHRYISAISLMGVSYGSQVQAEEFILNEKAKTIAPKKEIVWED